MGYNIARSYDVNLHTDPLNSVDEANQEAIARTGEIAFGRRVFRINKEGSFRSLTRAILGLFFSQSEHDLDMDIALEAIMNSISSGLIPPEAEPYLWDVDNLRNGTELKK